MGRPDAVVVGAGPAGIATALALKDAGLLPLVVDRADSVASSWRGRYDRLRLNTCRWLSHLPGRRFPKGTPMFPTRDQLIDHLERHAGEDGIELRLETRVERIDREDGGWMLRTTGDEIRAPQVVVATGYEDRPNIPAWADEGFEGTLLHSSEYREPEPFRGNSVLVVGPGCSGMEIAYDLAEGGAAKVWLSVRTPPNIQLREGPGGFPGDVIAVSLLPFPVRFADALANFGRRMDIGDLSECGLPVPAEGVFARYRRIGAVPTIVDAEVIEAVKDGRIEVVRGVEALDAGEALLADSSRVRPDVIICATGYHRGLEPMVGHLGVLGERGVPLAQGEEQAAPGLRFVGYTSRPGALGYMSKQARRAAKAIAREARG